MGQRIIGGFCAACLTAACFVIPFFTAGAGKTVAADERDSRAAVAPTPEDKAPPYLYKGIAIGTPADDVRKKLGDPKDKSDAQDLFVFSDEESVQFIYGADKKVSAVMVTFSGKLTGAPTAKDVFGEDVPPKPDGGIFKMVRYPKAGYWISYNKIVGDDSMVSIAMQKL